MILVDSGVLIDFLRTKDAKLAALLRSLPVAVCGATRAEICCGARSAADRQRLVVFLSPFQQVSIADSLWDALGDNLAVLRKRHHGSFGRRDIATVAWKTASKSGHAIRTSR